MGWNDHFDFDLDESIEIMLDEGTLEEGSLEHEIAKEACWDYGVEAMTPERRHIWEQIIVPKLPDREERDREAYMDYLMSKDD